MPEIGLVKRSIVLPGILYFVNDETCGRQNWIKWRQIQISSVKSPIKYPSSTLSSWCRDMSMVLSPSSSESERTILNWGFDTDDPSSVNSEFDVEPKQTTWSYFESNVFFNDMDFTINASIECMFLPLDLISQSLWTHMAHGNVTKKLKLDLFLSSEHIIFVKVHM